MPKYRKIFKKEEAPANDHSLAVLIIQIVLLLLGIMAYFYFTAQNYVVYCVKDENAMINCTLRKTVLSTVTLEKRTLTGLVAAAVTDQCQGANCKYRLELYDNQGTAYPVVEHYTPDNVVKERVSKLINQFVVQTDRRDMKVREKISWLVFMLPISAIVAFVIYRLTLVKPK